MANERDGHVFLSHAGVDTAAAHEFAEILRRSGLSVWFDKDSIQPGDPWMTALEQAIQEASAMIVYVGRLGVQAWVDREVRFGLVRNTDNSRDFRLVPVLGPEADPAALPPFLMQQQWVDLRDSQRAPEQIRRLIEILKSPSKQRAIPENYWTAHSPFRSLQVFEPEDSWLFFGRDSDSNELLSRLGQAPVLAVLGNSGCGKSSLIRAGLMISKDQLDALAKKDSPTSFIPDVYLRNCDKDNCGVYDSTGQIVGTIKRQWDESGNQIITITLPARTAAEQKKFVNHRNPVYIPAKECCWQAVRGCGVSASENPFRVASRTSGLRTAKRIAPQ